MEIELACLFLLHVVGTSIFGKFESETAWWRLVLKWAVVAGVTLFAYRHVGHYSLLILIFFAMAGLLFHFAWCRKNGIHPLKATPRKKYFQLRKWIWYE